MSRRCFLLAIRGLCKDMGKCAEFSELNLHAILIFLVGEKENGKEDRFLHLFLSIEMDRSVDKLIRRKKERLTLIVS